MKHARTAHRQERRRRWFDFAVHRVGIFAVAGLLLLATAYVGVDTMVTNHRVSAQSNEPVAAVKGGTAAPTDASQEGTDKTIIPVNVLAKYSVAPDLPRALYINKIRVAARVLPMSVNTDGSVQAPINIYDSGWYTGSVKPGEIGAVFIDGHSSGSTHEGLFGNADQLVVGDTMQIEKGDDTRLTYKVVHTATVGINDVNMNQMLLPYDHVLRGLNLITCTGNWTGSGKSRTLDHRIEIFTEQVSSQ